MDYLSSIGVGAILLNSIYQSSNKDFGYDVTDFTAIDEELGTMQDFEEMITVFHDQGMDYKSVLWALAAIEAEMFKMIN